jgi:hypothetical protein
VKVAKKREKRERSKVDHPLPVIIIVVNQIRGVEDIRDSINQAEVEISSKEVAEEEIKLLLSLSTLQVCL